MELSRTFLQIPVTSLTGNLRHSDTTMSTEEPVSCSLSHRSVSLNNFMNIPSNVFLRTALMPNPIWSYWFTSKPCYVLRLCRTLAFLHTDAPSPAETLALSGLWIAAGFLTSSMQRELWLKMPAATIVFSTLN